MKTGQAVTLYTLESNADVWFQFGMDSQTILSLNMGFWDLWAWICSLVPICGTVHTSGQRHVFKHISILSSSAAVDIHMYFDFGCSYAYLINIWTHSVNTWITAKVYVVFLNKSWYGRKQHLCVYIRKKVLSMRSILCKTLVVMKKADVCFFGSPYVDEFTVSAKQACMKYKVSVRSVFSYRRTVICSLLKLW